METGSVPDSTLEMPGQGQAGSMPEMPGQAGADREGDGSIPEGVLELPVQAQADAPTVNVLDKDVQARLRRSTYDFAKCAPRHLQQ